MRAAEPDSTTDVAVIALRYEERRKGLTSCTDDCVVEGCEDAIKSGVFAGDYLLALDVPQLMWEILSWSWWTRASQAYNMSEGEITACRAT